MADKRKRHTFSSVQKYSIEQAFEYFIHAKVADEEIRRRERVIRIFPNRESALRLVGVTHGNR